MDEISQFALVAGLVVVAPYLAMRLTLPAILGEILAGLLVGPYALGLVEISGWVATLGELGLLFLMFLAGLEIKSKLIQKNLFATAAIGAAIFAVPFASAYLFAGLFLEGTAVLIIAAAISATSISIIFPLTKELGISKKPLGNIMLGAAMICDILSLIALSYATNAIGGNGAAAILKILLVVAALFVISARYSGKFIRRIGKSRMIEIETRIILFLILLFSIISESIGVHAIITAFFFGLAISLFTPSTKKLEEKLNPLGHGLLVPLFFIYVGMKTNLLEIVGSGHALLFTAGLITVALASKTASGNLMSLAFRETKKFSMGIGLLLSANIAVGIAAAEMGLKLGILGSETYSAIIVTALFSVFIPPAIAKKIISEKIHGKKPSGPLQP